MGSIGFDPNRSRIGTDGSDDTTQIGNVIYDGSSRGRGNGSLTVDGGLSDKAHSRRRMNAKLANPLAGFTTAELEEMGANYARKYRIGDEDDVHTFRKGAVLAQNPLRFESMTILDEADKVRLREEVSNRWKQPKLLYLVIVLCSTCAAVQGMDETVVNGAQIFYAKQFGIDGKDDNSTYLVGLTNAGPYLACALIGCWLTIPFNNIFGRRGTIFITCLFSAITCFWQAFTNTWWGLFVARFALGFGIGPKSATVPIYAAECAPPAIRGGLVMQWQMWTAFGIMLGYVSDLVFYQVPDPPGIVGLNWRLMLASAMLPAVIVCCFVFLVPESPRWYMQKQRHEKAYQSMNRLRYTKLQSARDLFYMHCLLEAESGMKGGGRAKVLEMVTVGRNRRALIASEVVMFMQQFCGVNVIAYYSTQIFVDAGFPQTNALLASFGFGVINFLFAIPAIYTIDNFGRRNLLLFTFPFMALFLFFTGFSFWIDKDSKAYIACITLGIYLFGIVYSPGEGPVPFTYSAEAYPLYIRTYGMSLATATTWLFNFILAFTLPKLLVAFKPQGTFAYYATWNLFGWMLVLLFVPETKGKTLEELDQVFGVPTRVHAAYGLRQVPYFIGRYLLRRPLKPERLFSTDKVVYRGDSFMRELQSEPEKRV